MLYEKNKQFPVLFEEDGIMVDFVEKRFVCVIKDQSWSDFEIQALHRNKITISFLYERVCAIFLLAVHDAIDTSDAAFDIHNCEEKDTLLVMNEPFDMEIYLVDKDHQICASRKISFTKAMSEKMKESFIAQQAIPYDDEGFDRALAKLQGSYEPFEMEPMAICEATF